MADKIFEDSEFICKRFSCNCLDHHHILDISVEFFSDKVIGDKADINFSWSISGEMSIWGRIKKALKVLVGREYLDCDIGLRYSDIDELIGLLQKAKEQRVRDSKCLITK